MRTVPVSPATGDVLLRACPKCVRGAMALDYDVYGTFRHCTTCGHEVALTTQAAPAARSAGTSARRSRKQGAA